MIPNNLTIVERQILANQYRLLAKIEKDSYYETLADILVSGYTGKYHEVFDVHQDEIPIEICEETSEILNMYRRIDVTIASLKQEEKEQLNLEKLKFEGFDANNDSHYHYGKFMIEKLNLWEEHKDIYFNSHSQFPLMKYKKMLEYHNNKIELGNYDITFDDLIKMQELI